MKRLVSFFAVLILFFGSLGFVGIGSAQADYVNDTDVKLTEIGTKIDLNNSDIRDFRALKGFYPGLASAIIKNAPYEKVDQVLSIPGISDTQKSRLQANLDLFVVSDPIDAFVEGDDRFNPGAY